MCDEGRESADLPETIDDRPARTGRQRAIALRYGPDDGAPHVVAAGAGEIARQILRLAEAHQVPIKRNDSLVEILSKLDIGYEIPPETYRVVAEILAFLYRTDEAWRKRKELEQPNMAKLEHLE